MCVWSPPDWVHALWFKCDAVSAVCTFLHISADAWTGSCVILQSRCQESKGLEAGRHRKPRLPPRSMSLTLPGAELSAWLDSVEMNCRAGCCVHEVLLQLLGFSPHFLQELYISSAKDTFTWADVDRSLWFLRELLFFFFFFFLGFGSRPCAQSWVHECVCGRGNCRGRVSLVRLQGQITLPCCCLHNFQATPRHYQPQTCTNTHPDWTVGFGRFWLVVFFFLWEWWMLFKTPPKTSDT